ncbi:unnamed protein product [Mytilus coruscus]|uniref:Uncharacterized protein n=1 Tax=Mytilus coruscus TaxID=42192 RepID=A0A6J8D0X0_MYTCO|nr:unnamed protein product [Mytilus coruscus]
METKNESVKNKSYKKEDEETKNGNDIIGACSEYAVNQPLLTDSGRLPQSDENNIKDNENPGNSFQETLNFYKSKQSQSNATPQKGGFSQSNDKTKKSTPEGRVRSITTQTNDNIKNPRCNIKYLAGGIMLVILIALLITVILCFTTNVGHSNYDLSLSFSRYVLCSVLCTIVFKSF